MWYAFLSWNRPRTQWVQDVEPATFVTVPMSQSLQAWPVLSWYWPTSHSVHTVCGASAYLPSAQAVQESELYCVLMEPCGQSAQVPCWPPTTCCPGPHAGVGAGVGALVGEDVVGAEEGALVGAEVGALVGAEVGAGVGIAAHAVVPI